jgi:hypothetical protein
MTYISSLVWMYIKHVVYLCQGICYHMDRNSRDTLLTLSVSALILIGIIFVAIIPDPTLTYIGFGLIVLGLIIFIVDARDFIVRTDKKRKK